MKKTFLVSSFLTCISFLLSIGLSQIFTTIYDMPYAPVLYILGLLSGLVLLISGLTAICSLLIFCWGGLSKHPPLEKVDWASRRISDNKYTVQNIPFLIDELRYGNRHIRAETLHHLTLLLPQMKESDSDLLHPDQRDHLNRELVRVEGRHNPEFRIAILKAWEQVGNEDALDSVLYLAGRRYTAASEKPVTAAAQQCLPFLYSSIEREKLRVYEKSLLRAADTPPIPSHELLRPAVSTENAPEQLLRPGNKPI